MCAYIFIQWVARAGEVAPQRTSRASLQAQRVCALNNFISVYICCCVAVCTHTYTYIHTCILKIVRKWDKFYCEAWMKNCTKKTHTQTCNLNVSAVRIWAQMMMPYTHNARHTYTKRLVKLEWNGNEVFAYGMVPKCIVVPNICVCDCVCMRSECFRFAMINTYILYFIHILYTRLGARDRDGTSSVQLGAMRRSLMCGWL